jgi:Cof subfamily protein (haloacid dehalogenase superfamily)
MRSPGWLALDIDGTLTDHSHTIPQEVKAYLKNLYEKGWHFLFITGRMFSYAHGALDDFDFPYIFAVQNGADVLEMPARKVISRRYLSKDVALKVEAITQRFNLGFLVYSGYEKGDFCIYNPKSFSRDLLAYFERLKDLSKQAWIESDRFDQLEDFPLIKILGSEEQMVEISHELNLIPGISTTMIRDPMRPDLFLQLITHYDVTKGAVVERIANKHPIIGAGDDLNDVSLLEACDVRIAMTTAPKRLKDLADIIADAGAEMGIIAALERAIR